MTEKLVSILTPCYNGEKYIDAYAESLLAQEYSNCEIIFMDDGSTDGTAEKIMSYETRFKEKGFSFSYHYHQNGGPAYAIAQGLQYVTGDYLTWPDVDDRLTPDSIRKKVELLEEHPEYGIVRTDYNVVDEKEPNKVVISGGVKKVPSRFHEEVFEDYLRGISAWYQPGCFMVRMEAFLRANPDRYIHYPSHGQNIQMLLPVFYHYKCAFIPEALYVYVRHADSRQAQAMRNYETAIQSYILERETTEATIRHMHVPEEARYLRMANLRYAKRMLEAAYKHRKQPDAIRYYRDYRNAGGDDYRYLIKAVFAGSKLYHAAGSARARLKEKVVNKGKR